MRISKSRIDMDDNILRKPVIEDYGETIVGGVQGVDTGSSYTIDITTGNAFHLILTANCAFTFSNPAASGTATTFTLYLRQDSTGSRTVTWPSAVEWASNTAPTLTTTPNYLDIFSFMTVDGGTTWFGFIGAQNFANPSAYDVISSLGLTSNLRLCLDVGDSSSYSSGQSWLDLSGNGYDFFRGATSGSSTDDPTFNGTAGNLSSAEYWSFDGGDFFRYDTTNETWMQNLHKDGAQYTILVWAYLISSASANGLLATAAPNNNEIGIHFFKQTADELAINVRNGSGTGAAFYKATSALSTYSQWAMYGVTIDENGGSSASFFTVNGAYEQSGGSNTWSGAYSSPSASSATQTCELASRAGSGNLGSGSRMATMCVWEGTTLSQSDHENFFTATRNRFEI